MNAERGGCDRTGRRRGAGAFQKRATGESVGAQTVHTVIVILVHGEFLLIWNDERHDSEVLSDDRSD
jgi:hypothetical protein